MSVFRPALAFAGFIIGAAALVEFVRQPARRLVRQGEDRDRRRWISDEDAAGAVRPDLELEPVRRRDAPAGADWFVAFTHGHPDNLPVYAGRWPGSDPFTLNLPKADHA